MTYGYDHIAMIFSFEMYKWFLHERKLEPFKIKPDKRDNNRVIFYYPDTNNLRSAYEDYKEAFPTRNNCDIIFKDTSKC